METNQLTFEHICFKYKGNDNQLFTDLDVTMETGQVVGIFGNKTDELNYFLDHELSTRHCPRRSLEQLINPPHRYELGI